MFEVGSNSVDLVDQIFNTSDSKTLKMSLDQPVVGERNTLASHFGKTTLVNKLTDALEVRISVGNVWFHTTNQLGSGFVETNEDSVVDLSQSEELQNLTGSWGDSVNTSDTDNKGQLRLGFSEIISTLFGHSSKADEFLVSGMILFFIFLSLFEDVLSLDKIGLNVFSDLSSLDKAKSVKSLSSLD